MEPVLSQAAHFRLEIGAVELEHAVARRFVREGGFVSVRVEL